MYAEKSQWITFIIAGVIFIVGYNFGLAIRDSKGINQMPQLENSEYKQLPVIPPLCHNLQHAKLTSMSI